MKFTPAALFKSLFSSLHLTSEFIEQVARETGFEIRKPAKIPSPIFLGVLLEESITGSPSCNDLAEKIARQVGISVSRQAIALKFDERCVKFMTAILEQAMRSKLPRNALDTLRGSNCPYGRVLVQDSTIVKLPQWLFEEFSGVSNAHTKVCNARIQVVYDLLDGEFVQFSIDPYSKNDITAAPELEFRANDLVLRDRGYLSAEEIQRHIDAGAHCIFRYKAGTHCFDSETGKRIDLLRLLQERQTLDIQIRLKNAKGTECRLVAVPVDEETANLRRMKLKKESKGHNPSEDLLALMSWTIFLTTVARSDASFEILLECYGLRWRIETTFKAWKSNLEFAKLHHVSSSQFKCLLYARLTMATIMTHMVYRPLLIVIQKKYNRDVSLIKLFKYLVRNLNTMAELLQSIRSGLIDNGQLNAVARYCTYDKRKRSNFGQKMSSALNLCL